MKITAIIVSDDVRDFCDAQELPHPKDIDAWLATHQNELTEAMEYAAMNEIRRLLTT